MKLKLFYKIFLFTVMIFTITSVFVYQAWASPIPSLDLSIRTTDDPTQVASTLQLLFLLTVITLAPSILILFTCFTRIIIVFHFLRSALGTQQMPPNQIMIGLALFLTFYLMGPTFSKINETALKPYSDGKIGQEAALNIAMEPIREFMIKQAEDKDIKLFAELDGRTEAYTSLEELPNRVLIPAFVLGEITKGFKIGFYIYIPFIAIDMVVASVLMAMGMMMLPPAMISLPFKILLFLSAGGWKLVIQGLILTFQ